MGSRIIQCVICCKSYEKPEVGREHSQYFSCLSDGSGSKLLNDHLYVYFVTRKLLKLPEKQCLKTIGLLSDDDPASSFSMCQDCNVVVSKGVEVQYQIVNLTREIDKLGSSLQQLVHENSDDNNGEHDHHQNAFRVLSKSFRLIRRCLTSAAGSPSIVKRERGLEDVAGFSDDNISGEDDFFLKDSASSFWEDKVYIDAENLHNDSSTPLRSKVKRERVCGSDSDSDYVPERSTSMTRLKVGGRSRSECSNIKVDRKGSHFPCQFCKTTYYTVPGFIDHLRLHAESDQLKNKYDCSICNHPHVTEDKLRRHLIQRHESQKKTCKICGHVAQRRSHHEKHMLNKHKIKVWTPMTEDTNPNEETQTTTTDCQNDPLQSESFEEMAEADYLGIFESKGNNFHCKMCDSVYTTVPGCKKHVKAHELSNQLGNMFDCTVCRHPNTSERNLGRHMTRIHSNKAEKSNKLKEFHSPSFLMENELVESSTLSPETGLDEQSKKTFNCKRCKSVYTTILGFRKHLNAHHKSDSLGNQYDCAICGHPTTCERNLSRHYTAIHKQNKNYTAVYKARGDHQKQNQDPLPCTSNINVTHQIESPEEQKSVPSTSEARPGKRLLRCKYCQSVYGSRTGMIKHMRMHRESKQLGNVFDCSICNHPNTSEAKLRRHTTHIHSSSSVKTARSPEYVLEDSLPQSSSVELNSERPKRASVGHRDLLDANDDNGLLKPEEGDEDYAPLDETEYLDDSSKEEGSDSDWNGDSDFEMNRKRKRKRSSYTGNGNSNDVSFHCDKCNVSYKSARGFRTHQEEHESSIVLGHKYDCKKCGFPNSSERRLRYHTKRAHQGTPILFNCSICGYRAPSSQHLKRHMKKHNPACQGRKIGRPSKWSEHVNTEGSFECRVCKANYGGSDALKNHMNVHKRSDGKYDCDICKFPCCSEKKLRIHQHVKHGKPYNPTCVKCNKFFLRPNKLRDHMQIHAKYDKLLDPETGDYRCNICPFVGTFKGVIIHKNHHHKGIVTDPSDEPHMCSECGLGFTTQQTLKQHVRNKHENRYRFTCEICGRGFQQKMTIESHMKTHQENRTREFICSVCGTAYSHKKTLNEHTNRFHPQNSASKRKQKEGCFKCKFCQTVFPFKYQLVNHIPTAHKDLYTHECDICDKTYISASSLKLHKEITHSDGALNHSCQYCGKTFPHKHYVICHYKFCNRKKENDKSRQPGPSNTENSEEDSKQAILPVSALKTSSSVSVSNSSHSNLVMMPINDHHHPHDLSRSSNQ